MSPEKPTPRRSAAILVAFSLLVSACGSTVRATQSDGAPFTVGEEFDGGASGFDDGLAVPGTVAGPTQTGGVDGTSGGGAGTSGSPGTSAGAAASPGAPASGATPGAPAPGTPTPAAATPGDATPDPGVVAGDGSTEPIKLGFAYLEGATNAMNGLGTEVSFGDGRLEAQALVEELNARGGINGRPIEPFYSGVDVAVADKETEYNATCTELTEDHGVFAVLTPINPPASFVACVAQHQTLLLNASFNPGDDGLYAEFGEWFFSPSLLSLDRGVHLMVDTLVAEGAFEDPLVKVGVLYTGDPQGVRVVENTMVPRLEALGVSYELAEATEVPQVSAAQLRFAATGVNLVMFVHPSGIAQLLFMQAAENQGYRPRYMTTDSDSTRFVSENAPRNQARNIRGVGTLPVANVPVRSYPTTVREQRCLDVIREGGEDNEDRLTNLTATVYCELVWSFEAVASQAPGALSHDSFRQAYRSLGTAYDPVTTFQIDFSTGRNDNTTLYRPYAWDDGCSCMAYTGPPTPVG